MSFDNKIGEGKYIIAVDNQGAIQQLQKFEQSAKKTGDSTTSSFKTSLASAVSLGSGLASLYNQYDNLEKMQLRIRKSSLEVSRAQETVNKLAQEGKQGTLDYEQAQEKLAIAQERLSQLNGDLKQSQLGITLSFAQTALSLPAAITAIKGLSGATSVLNAVNSKWLIVATGVILAYEGIAHAIKLFNPQLDITIEKLSGDLFNSITKSNSALADGTTEFKAYGEEIKTVGINASDTASSFGDLNTQMDRTISKLKKNDLSDSLAEVQAQMADSMIFMGSLEQIVNRFRAAGVEGFVREIQKDLRTLKTEFGVDLGVGFRDALFERNFTARGMNNAQARMLSTLSANVSNYFREIVADVRNGLNGLSFTKGIHGNLDFLGGITKTETANLINGGKTGSTGSRSGSSRARSGKFGGMKGPLNETFEVQIAQLMGARTASGDRGTGQILLQNAQIEGQKILNLLRDEGVGLPDFYTGMRGGKGDVRMAYSQTAYQERLTAAIAEANRRRAERMERERLRILGLSQDSGLSTSEVIAYESTSQGLDDLNGIIDFRKRIALASSGT